MSVLFSEFAEVPGFVVAIFAVIIVAIVKSVKTKGKGNPSNTQSDSNGMFDEHRRIHEQMHQQQLNDVINQTQQQQFDLATSIADKFASDFTQTQFDTMQQTDMFNNNMFNM